VGLLLTVVLVGVHIQADAHTTSAGECLDEDKDDYSFLDAKRTTFWAASATAFHVKACARPQRCSHVRWSWYRCTTGPPDAKRASVSSTQASTRRSPESGSQSLYTTDGAAEVHYMGATDYLENGGNKLVQVVFSNAS